MKVITWANQKGGVGKSTLALHNAFDLHEKGKKVLFIDLDPQGNSSRVLEPYKVDFPASGLFRDSGRIPAGYSMGLIAADNGLFSAEQPYSTISLMEKHLSGCSDHYDYCVIDTPPTNGLYLRAALVLSDHVISPIELEQFALDGIEGMVKTIIGIKQQYNPNLNYIGMLANRYDPRSTRQKAALLSLNEKFSRYVLPQAMRIRSTIPEALAQNEPVWNLKKTTARDAGRQFREIFQTIYDRMGTDYV